MVQLGDEVRDAVSGFLGVAISRTEYLNGCARISVQPPVGRDGKLPEYQTFDEPQLKIIKVRKVVVTPMVAGVTGGPDRYMPRDR